MVKGRAATWSTAMSEASEFQRYADEALRWALKSTTAKERATLFELARTWTEAARASEHPMPIGVNYSPARPNSPVGQGLFNG